MNYLSSISAMHQTLQTTSPEFARIFRFVLQSHTTPHTLPLDEHDRTPLHYTAFLDIPDVLDWQLATLPYDPNWADCMGQTALHTALSRCSERPYKTTHTLLVHGADPNYSPSGPTPLMLAVLKEDCELVKMLLEAGADPNQRLSEAGLFFRRGETALSLAVRLNTLHSTTTPSQFTHGQLETIFILVQSATLTPNTLFHALQQTKHPVLKKYTLACAN